MKRRRRLLHRHMRRRLLLVLLVLLLLSGRGRTGVHGRVEPRCRRRRIDRCRWLHPSCPALAPLLRRGRARRRQSASDEHEHTSNDGRGRSQSGDFARGKLLAFLTPSIPRLIVLAVLHGAGHTTRSDASRAAGDSHGAKAFARAVAAL